MVLKPEPVWRALKALGMAPSEHAAQSEEEEGGQDAPWVILPTPKGRKLTQERLVEMSKLMAKRRNLVFLCSRYKGIDERIRKWVDEEISLGDYVIGGGEAAALVMIEGIIRLLPDVVGDRESVDTDSFTCGLLSGPAYTRPAEFNGEKVPEVLLSGHHEEIRRWRRKQALALTVMRRPDILARLRLNDEDEKLLSEVLSEQARRG
jgi:tRNA (guanine37-N1)-methyltransferase